MLQGLVRAALLLALLGFGVVAPSAPAHAAPARIDSYPQPAIYPRSPDYELIVNGQRIDVVDYPGYDYAHFSMAAGEATISVRKLNNTAIGAYTISPRKLGLRGTVSGPTLTFTIPNDEYLIVKLDGRPDLVIAADPAETDRPASSGPRIHNVVTYGADATGRALSTSAVQNAVNAANAAGGGTVYVPAGVYLVGNVLLKSNVSLYLAPGTVFRFTGNPADYTKHWHKDSQNRDITWWISTEFGSSNIRVFGRGTLDSNGAEAISRFNFAANILVPIGTSNFRFDGLIVRESGAWAIVTARSQNLTFTNVKIFNRLDMGENDGIDVNESQNVVVRHGIGISLDDPWTTKAWREDTDIALPWPGSPQPVENVLFDDLISWTRCYGFKIGQGTLQPQSNVTFRNGVVYDAAIGIGIHHRYGSAAVSNVTFDSIDVERIGVKLVEDRTWLRFIIENPGLGAGPVRNVTVSNVTVRDKGTTFAVLKGLDPSANFSNVRFDRVTMPGATSPATTLTAMNILDRANYHNVSIAPQQDPEPQPRPNLALGKAATASSGQAIAPLAVDGDVSTRWGSDRSDDQWFQVDLGTPTPVSGVTMLWEAAYARAYALQLSDDGVTWREVHSTNNGTGGVEAVDFSPATTRYVRLRGIQRATQYGYSLWEFQVH
ncbi:coagulation factor 5/8 type domain protein [Kribbella flavida DSM 17836]|uniref:Coagulation factor 5/8 type domain protein n=1 Tax=Kribbella flavida (strain DSM 17836 / JCM 10339 / NBRC 14399) TaxID=479435 RepID=D2Q244_KRIFD|nr:discoidin domain-containing protein [Kribbella flavida]ADB33990.1 coagulation factor 5/8 type domain protein [Kribbella flavida DSM 17836]